MTPGRFRHSLFRGRFSIDLDWFPDLKRPRRQAITLHLAMTEIVSATTYGVGKSGDIQGSPLVPRSDRLATVSRPAGSRKNCVGGQA